MSESADSARIDALWEDLAPHVEWPEGFSLVVLFAGHPGPVSELRERLEVSLRQRDKSLARIDPAAEDEVRALLSEILGRTEPGCGALWISLLRGAGNAEWTGAVRWLLQRLNERRFVLERDVRVPVVVVLPLELRTEIFVLAPDLWSVRGFSEVVPGPMAEETGFHSVPHVVPREAAEETARGGVRPPGRVEAEWARLLATGDLPRLSIWDGVAAQEASLERGDLRAARRIAMETLAVALSPAGVVVERLDDFDVTEALAEVDPHSAQVQRELSVSLERLGNIEVQAGNLAVARSLFQRSLDLREALAKADPHSAQAKRDVSVSLNKLGDVEAQAGNLAVARALFQRSLSVSEALAEADPQTAHIQRDISVFLNRLGDIEVQAGNLAAARFLFQRSLSIAEGLADPHNAQTQRDLSAFLNQLGDVEVQAGNLAAARSLFQRSLSVAEALANAVPDSARARRDLSVCFENLGDVEVQAGNLAVARSLFQRSLDLRDALANANPQSAQAQRDLAISLSRLGDVEVRANNLAAARSLFQRDLAIAEALADPHNAQAQRDLSISFEKLGVVELKAGNLAAARSLFQRSLDLREALADADPHDAQASFDVVESLDCLARVAERQADRATELDYLRRAHTILTAMDANGQVRDYAERQRLLEDITRRLS